MPKSEFARGTLTFDSVDYGITDVTIDEVWSEIDVTDTESTLQESEFLGGRRSYNIQFTMFKNAGTADLSMNDGKTAIFKVLDSAATFTTYTGTLILLSKSISGTIDGAVTANYGGRISGALTEAQG